MKLSEYMEKYYKTTTELAKAFNTSTGYLHDLKTGRRTPSLEMIIMIEKKTYNKVKAADWISEKSHQEKSVVKKARKSKCQSVLALAALCEVGP